MLFLSQYRAHHGMLDLADVFDGLDPRIAYEGELVFDADKPDGAPRKLLDVSRLSDMGWQSTTKLLDGLRLTYDWYLASEDTRGL